MSNVAEIRSVIDEHLDAGSKALDALAADGPATILRVIDASLEPRGVAPEVRAETAGRIADILVRAIEHGRKTIAFERKLAGAMGDPDALRARASAVQSEVAKAATELAPQVTSASLEAVKPENWIGQTAERYRSSVRGREDAVAAIPNVASLVGRSLESMADSIDEYYVSLAAQVSATTVSLLGIAVSIDTWETASGGILNVGATLARIEGELATTLTTALQRARTVDEQLAEALESPLQWPTGGDGAAG